MSDLPAEYQDHILDSPEVCSNCFAVVREPRDSLKPSSWYNKASLDDLDTVDRGGKNSTLVRESYYGRREDTTLVTYVPAENASECKQIFCNCGVNSSFYRYWTWRDVDRPKFRLFLKNLIRSARSKGLTIARQPAAAHALAAYDSFPHPDHHGPYRAAVDHTGCIDDALATGLLAGLRIGAIRSRSHASASGGHAD